MISVDDQITMHQLPTPGENSKPFCALHLGIRVTKNTVQSSTGWNNGTIYREQTEKDELSIVAVILLLALGLFLWLIQSNLPTVALLYHSRKTLSPLCRGKI